MELLFDLAAIGEAAKLLWAHSGPGSVVALHGQMGAGKTTLVHALCKMLGVREAVSSPTFSLINQYSYPGGTLYHIDLYRLGSLDEAIRAGVEEAIESGGTCIVEWPERAESLFPADTLHVYLETVGHQERRMVIETEPKEGSR